MRKQTLSPAAETPNPAPVASTHRCADDLALVTRARRGERNALEALATKLACIPAMIRARERYSSSRLSQEDVDELTQEILATIWSRLGSYAGEAPVEGWAHAFVVRMHLRFRSTRRLATSLADCPVDTLPYTEDDTVTLDDEYLVLQEALAALRATQAFIVREKHFKERTFNEIADELSIPPATVKTKYYRGLSSLKVKLARYWSERQRVEPKRGRRSPA